MMVTDRPIRKTVSGRARRHSGQPATAAVEARCRAILDDAAVCFILKKLGYQRVLRQLRASAIAVNQTGLVAFEQVTATDQYQTLLALHRVAQELVGVAEPVVIRQSPVVATGRHQSDPEIVSTMRRLNELWGEFPTPYRILVRCSGTPLEQHAQNLLEELDDVWYNATALGDLYERVTRLHWRHQDLERLWPQAQTYATWLTEHVKELPAGFRGEARKVASRLQACMDDPSRLPRLIDQAQVLKCRARPPR